MFKGKLKIKQECGEWEVVTTFLLDGITCSMAIAFPCFGLRKQIPLEITF